MFTHTGPATWLVNFPVFAEPNGKQGKLDQLVVEKSTTALVLCCGVTTLGPHIAPTASDQHYDRRGKTSCKASKLEVELLLANGVFFLLFFFLLPSGKGGDPLAVPDAPEEPDGIQGYMRRS